MSTKKYVFGTVHSEEGGTVQVLPPDQATHTKLTVDATSRSFALSGAKVIRVASDVDLFLWFGTSGVTADSTGIYFPAGVETISVPAGATHVAQVQNATAGLVTITAMGDA